MLIGLKCYMKGDMTTSVHFIGRDVGDDQWVELPRKRWPWRFNPKPMSIADMIETPQEANERRTFMPFAKRTGIFHVDKEFQPV